MSKKFSPMRFTAATEEAAVEGALRLVGATRDEISYDFISQTAKGVTVRVRPFEPEETPAEPIARADENQADESSEDEDAEFDVEESEEFDVEEDEASEVEAPLHIDSMHDFDESPDDSPSDAQDDDEEISDDDLDFDASLELADDEYDLDVEDESDEDEDDNDDDLDDEDVEIEIDSAMLERALTLARAMLEKMGLDAQVERGHAVSADTIPLSIEGEDVGILIGKYGATLQSFQYLMNLTLNNGDAHALRVSVDAGNYRARRQESLEAVARGAAQRARREGRPIKMEPMPSNERRIVHDILQSEPGVSTQSEGREPHRCVVVAPGQSDYSGASDSRSRRGMGGYGRGRGGRNRR